MAGQWVEPGGGVPTAVMRGRHAAPLISADEGWEFIATGMSGNDGRVPKRKAGVGQM